MTEACRRSLVHGPLLLLRYTLGGLPWTMLMTARGGSAGTGSGSTPTDALRIWIDRMLGLLEKVEILC